MQTYLTDLDNIKSVSKNSNNLLFAMLISLLLHILLVAALILFEIKSKQEEEPPRIRLGNIKLKDIIEKEKKLPIAPPIEESKPTQRERPKTESILTPLSTPKQKPKPKREIQRERRAKELKKELPKIEQKAILSPISTPKAKNSTTTPPKKESLSAFLSKPSMPSIKDIANSFIDQTIERLYGDEFGSFNKEQQEFIRENLKAIGSITQKYLKYPTIAGELGQKGLNIVEFNLHPNGDITDLRIIKGSGYALLDRNSIRTIEIAYKEYPHPKKVTKIRIYVQYILR